MNALAAAIRLLTVLPAPGRRTTDSIAGSHAYFPLVGLGIGGAMALVSWLAGHALPPLTSAALALATGIVLSGALHLDGLADSFDGIFGGGTPERRLEIMRDHSIGVFGIAALAVVLLTRWGAIASLGFGSGWAAIVLAPCLGRLAATWVISAHPYARSEGLGSSYRGGFGMPLIAALLFAAVAAVVFLGAWALIAVLVAVLVGESVARFAAGKLGGGVSGDVYGACIELAETSSVLCLLALLRTGHGVGFPFGG